ncbi:MAG TPA: chitinase [Firmicutes bacterium]|jgi:chitinase|nr:chitinase [Bacillota bacterium]
MFKIPSGTFKKGTAILLFILLCSIGIHAIYAKDTAPSYKIVTYLPLWKEWQARDIDVQRLTHINLAFAEISDGKIINKIKPAQLQSIKKMKRMNKKLKILISVGGWGTDGFSDAALTDESRIKFAKSVADYIHHYQLDGVDIDWEFPVIGAGDKKGLPEDKNNFTLLMQELRDKLDKRAKRDHRQYLLTFAANISLFYINSVELEKLSPLVDFINLMAYDFHGKWEHTTGLHTNLYSTPEDPTSLSADFGVKRYILAGVPPEKLILGTAFYGYGWSRVTNVNNGRYQTATGECKTYSYQNLAHNYINRNGFLRYWDDQAKAPYLWNGDTFITYEDQESLLYRTTYIRANQLGGIMIWEYCHDLDGTLLHQIFRELDS